MSRSITKRGRRKATAGLAWASSFTAGTHPSAMAFDGTNLWIVDGANVTELSPSGAVIGTFPVMYGSPAAIAFDGTNMWVATNGGYVTVLSPSGAMVGSFLVDTNLPGSGNLTGIAFDGTNMWVLGSQVTKLSPAGATLGTFPFDDGGNWAGGGIAFDGQHMWVAASVASGNNIIEL